MAYTKLGRIRPVYKGAWSSATAYTALEMVKSADGRTAYIALKDVPAGTKLTSTAYWGEVLDVSDVLDAAEEAIDAAVSRANEAALAANAAAAFAPDPLTLTQEGQPVRIWPEPGSLLRPVIGMEPIQSGSPAPDNACPIEGRSSVKLFLAKKNLVMNIKPMGQIDDPKGNPGVTFTRNEDGSIVVNGSVAEDAASYAEYVMTSSTTLYLPAGKYYVSGTPAELYDPETYGSSMPGPIYFQVAPFDSSAGSSVYDYGRGKEFILSKGSYMYLVIRIRKGCAVENAVMRPQIECIERTDYEPYQAQSVALNLGQTVYGGTLDVNSGLLTIDRKCYSFTGSENVLRMTSEASQAYQKKSRVFYYTGLTDAKPGLGTSICSHFTNNGEPVYSTAYDGATGIYCDNLDTSSVPHYKYFRWGTADSTADDFEAFLSAQSEAGTPVQVCYELAEPLTVQLTGREIAALDGMNTVFSTGDGMNLTYNKSLVREHEELLARIAALEAAAVNNA